jgi:hypothetical protein
MGMNTVPANSGLLSVGKVDVEELSALLKAEKGPSAKAAATLPLPRPTSCAYAGLTSRAAASSSNSTCAIWSHAARLDLGVH